jgi:hypothetical protein
VETGLAGVVAWIAITLQGLHTLHESRGSRDVPAMPQNGILDLER